ncbi:hypothetical protein PG990_004625 [Apiospora arundinis]
MAPANPGAQTEPMFDTGASIPLQLVLLEGGCRRAFLHPSLYLHSCQSPHLPALALADGSFEAEVSNERKKKMAGGARTYHSDHALSLLGSWVSLESRANSVVTTAAASQHACP